MHSNLVQVQLVGDFKPVTQAPTYENKVLFVPDFDISEQVDLELFVEREQISFDGTECNKIGTSYQAFNIDQGSRCLSKPYSCLAN